MFFQVLNIEKKLNFKLVLTSKKYPATLLLHDYIFSNAQCKLRLSYAETFPGKSKFNYIKGQRLALFKNQCWCWGQRSSSLWWFQLYYLYTGSFIQTVTIVEVWDREIVSKWWNLWSLFVDVPTEPHEMEEMLAGQAGYPDLSVHHCLLHIHLQDLGLHASLERRPGRVLPRNHCVHSCGQCLL